ncbi:MAG: permease [Enterobacterales bacterium]|nr:permease [Enterobacterales bacterium]
MIAYFWNFIDLFTESAPWLLLGLLIAGLMKWLVPMALLQKHMGDNSFSSVIKAALIGAPLPLCSCGVIPAAIGLKRAGASRSSTVSFLIATPETGVDSISVSYALLGPFFAIIRPFAAIFTAIYAGVMVKLFAVNEQEEALEIPKTDDKSITEGKLASSSSCCSTDQAAKTEAVAKSCCSSEPKIETEKKNCCSSEKKASNLEQTESEPQQAAATGCCSQAEKPAEKSESKSCCSSHSEATPVSNTTEAEKSCCSSEKPAAIEQRLTIGERLKQSLAFSAGKLLSDLTKWLLIGLLLAAAIKTWVSTDFFDPMGRWFCCHGSDGDYRHPYVYLRHRFNPSGRRFFWRQAFHRALF